VDVIERERDIEQLRLIARTQQTQIRILLERLSRQCTPVELQKMLDKLNRLQAEAEATADAAKQAEKTTRKKREQKGHGPTPQLELVHETELFELDEPDRTCPSCGGRLEALAGQCETSEMVDVIEVRYRVIHVQRQKYVCGCGGHVDTAPGPERVTAGGRYSLRFGVKVVTDKYVDHLPLARQSRILARHGLRISSQTLWDQVWEISQLLRPCYDKLYAAVLAEPVIGLDQTGWMRLEQRNGKPWQMWCLTSPTAIYHRICDDKSAATFRDLLGEFEGVIVCDALSTHTAGARASPGIVLAGCWAHVHRKFAEAEPDFPEAAEALAFIRRLYDIDASADSDEARGSMRRDQSTVALCEFEQWLQAQTALKTTNLGNAIRYTLGIWPRLLQFTHDPCIPLDNNRTERGIRGPVVGRKNHYGSKSRRGTEAAAILYSLIETAKLNGVEPAAYLHAACAAARRDQVLLPEHMRS
jgi:transposase